MKATIKEKKEIAKGTLSVVYDLLGKTVDFKPGQFFFVKLINPPYTDEKGNRRHFSIANSPDRKGILSMTTRIRDTAFKKSLRELPVGTEVEVGPIGGSFTLPDDTTHPIVFIAGGIGITPYISMLHHIKHASLPYKVSLIYSSRDIATTAYMDELKTFETQIPDFRFIPIMTREKNWSGETKHIDAQLIKKYFPRPDSQTYLVSGPPGVVTAVNQVLLDAGVTAEYIHTENFSGY